MILIRHQALAFDNPSTATSNCGSNLDEIWVKISWMCCFTKSTALTVTSTRSPRPTFPLNCPILLLCIKPSLPTPQSTNAPNDVMFVMRPLSCVPGWRSDSDVTFRLNKGFWKSNYRNMKAEWTSKQFRKGLLSKCKQTGVTRQKLSWLIYQFHYRSTYWLLCRGLLVV